jgi:DNA polymerase-3 subunit alpha
VSDKSFVHLHNHTEFSMLDGAARIKPLVTKAADLGMPAIAMTDHGNTHGAYEFWKQSKAAGIKPIIGIEAYLAPGSRLEKSKVRWADGGEDDVSGGGAYTHLTMWAASNHGMNNLFRLSSEGYLSGFYVRPRIDKELLAKYSKDLIATTGCPGGEVQTRLRLGQYDEALRSAAEFREIFGKDNFFVEVMDHSLEIEKRVRDDLLRLAKDLSLPLVATNDLHYVDKEDHTAHEALLCVQTGTNLNDPRRFKFESQEYYLKTSREMRSIFSELEDAADNTLLIAERCEIDFEKQDLLPRFPVPDGERRYPGGFSERHRQQVDYEIQVIIKMGFPGYFLVVSDFIAWARAQGIRVGPGRGSAAGSLASYALGITELDPLEHDLIFERFLNPERLSMPDIDVDFDDRRRPEVIRYVTDKYGDDRVAQIVTFGTIKAKQALKDAARVLGKPYSIGERLTKAMPPMVLGRDVSLDDVINKESERYAEAAEFREIIETDPESKEVFDLAKGLESLKSRLSRY